MAPKKFTIIINRRPVHVEQDTLAPADIVSLSGADGTGWDVLQLKGEDDPTGGEVLLAGDVIEVKSGLHFRVIPGNLTFGGAGGTR